MSTGLLIVILLIWAGAGLLVAIAIGKAIRATNRSSDKDSLASSSNSLD